jgi:hypothetical protein
LDSLRPDVRDFYEKEGVAIVDRGHDQETTDLQKCLAFAAADPRPSPSSPLLALGALGGRLDHTLAALSLMHADAHAGRLVLAGDGSLARCVPVGGAVFTPAPGVEGPACGLVALGGPVRASTEGLAWNLAPGAPPLAVGGPQSQVLFVVSDESLGVRSARWIAFDSFAVQSVDFTRQPTDVGALPGSDWMFVTQSHPQGRISFLNLSTGAMREVTGFSLNAFIE